MRYVFVNFFDFYGRRILEGGVNKKKGVSFILCSSISIADFEQLVPI